MIVKVGSLLLMQKCSSLQIDIQWKEAQKPQNTMYVPEGP